MVIGRNLRFTLGCSWTTFVEQFVINPLFSPITYIKLGWKIASLAQLYLIWLNEDQTSVPRPCFRWERDPTLIRPNCWKNCPFWGQTSCCGQLRRLVFWLFLRSLFTSRNFPACEFWSIEELSGECVPGDVWPVKDEWRWMFTLIYWFGPELENAAA